MVYECARTHTFKPEHVNKDKGSMQARSNYFQGAHKHERITVNLVQPLKRALFKVKSKNYQANQQDERAYIFSSSG
jgi:hypothetical protein